MGIVRTTTTTTTVNVCVLKIHSLRKMTKITAEDCILIKNVRIEKQWVLDE